MNLTILIIIISIIAGIVGIVLFANKIGNPLIGIALICVSMFIILNMPDNNADVLENQR